MKKITLFLFVAFSSLKIFAQPLITEKNIYNPSANAAADITAAVKEAKAQKKHVLIQAGGNWCHWCLEFNRFCKADPQIDSLLQSDYIIYHLNYSTENKNKDILAKYGFPQRFGFPVFIILDENGNEIHIQDSEYLEHNASYAKDKVMGFLSAWNYRATDPASYEKW